MTFQRRKITDSRFALQFLIEANIHSSEGIAPVPEQFIDKHLALVKKLNRKLEIAQPIPNTEPEVLRESFYRLGGTYYTKTRWHHKSVLCLMEEAKTDNPIEEVTTRARELVLTALSKGWSGPPFDAIALAKLLNFDIAPNDTILDARMVALSNNKVLIEYNPFQKSTRLNFSVGHEIAHTLFPDYHEEVRNREKDPVKNRELEQLCNIVASELQLPYVIFPAEANSIENITAHSLIQLAQKYKASLESLLIAFTEVVDKSCTIMVCTFENIDLLVIDYVKPSSTFDTQIPGNFKIPKNSRAYYCTAPGTTESETIKWDFMIDEHDVFYIGISPMRKENKPRVAVIIVPHKGGGKLQSRRIKIEFGDATKPRGEGIKIIAQVVNTSGGLGIGFGKSLSKNYPLIKDALKKWKNKKDFRLGNSQMIQVKEDTYVVQMLAQSGLYSKDGKIPLDYNSLKQCLSQLKDFALELKADVYMPLIGSGQAKGKWEIIEGLIYSELVNEDVNVCIYLYGSKKPEDFNPHSTLSLFNEQSTWQKEK